MKLGPYEVQESIGTGGAGSVYRAVGPDGRAVAIKVLHRLNVATTARFDRERRLLDALGADAGFVPLLDAGSSSAGPYIVMPFVAGGTLRKRLAAGRLGVEEAIHLATTLARALARAHERGIVHRDMKPENVLFTQEGAPLVADLGLAKHFEEGEKSASLSRTGELRGTAGYAPVEQMKDAKAAGPPADVFSLGAILYECLAGRPPFLAASLVELLAKVEEDDRPPLRELRPETPQWLVEIVERCLAQEPEERFGDAAELARALAARGRVRRPASGARAPVVVALAALIFALGFLTWAVLRQKDVAPPPPPPPPPVVSHADPFANAPLWFRERRMRPARLPKGVVFGTHDGEYVNEKDGSVLVWVGPGSFRVGTDWRETRGFFLGKYEVSNFQFARFVKETGWKTHAEKQGKAGVFVGGRYYQQLGAYWKFPQGHGVGEEPAPPGHPVVQLWWRDAVAYCDWAGLRLPTVEEWQKAAGWDPVAEISHVYPWGNDPPAGRRPVGNLADATFVGKNVLDPATLEPVKVGYDDGYERTAPVDAFPESASSYGALELGGNASEWVFTVYDRKQHGAVDERLLDASHRLVYTEVGASFSDHPAVEHAKVVRNPLTPNWPSEDSGFRVCRPED